MMVEPMISLMETQNYRTEPGKFEYFLVDGLKLPPTIVKPTFDALYNTGLYLKNLLEYNNQTPPLSNLITQSIKNLAKKIVNKLLEGGSLTKEMPNIRFSYTWPTLNNGYPVIENSVLPHPGNFNSRDKEIKRIVFYNQKLPNDTLYREVSPSFEKTVSNKNKDEEYEILKRKFNKAWNLAK